jgi:hypothetical protein
MSIDKIVEEREINEVLHFTTNKGLLGILDSKGLSSRARLSKNDRLEFILNYNSGTRKDTDWLDFVNLSISRINSSFFNSSGKWHSENIWWCILSFKPEILSHAGVVFTTTNNIYTSVTRSPGCEGLEKMFETNITQWRARVVTRAPELPKNYPTCEQAEVLYPKVVSTEYLQCIYVKDEESFDQVQAQIVATSHSSIEVILDADMFHGKIK